MRAHSCQVPALECYSAGPREQRPHILLVDDEVPICQVLSEYLGAENYNVTAALTVAEAVNLLQEYRFDLVVLDIVMPDANGLDLLKELKHYYPELPVLILTGLGFQDEIVQKARERGADGFLTKGLPLSELLFEIHRILVAKS